MYSLRTALYQPYISLTRLTPAAPASQNNPFARPFEEVVESLGIVLSRSTFDSSLYYIRRSDAGAFLEELKAIVAQYEADAHIAAQVAAA